MLYLRFVVPFVGAFDGERGILYVSLTGAGGVNPTRPAIAAFKGANILQVVLAHLLVL